MEQKRAKSHFGPLWVPWPPLAGGPNLRSRRFCNPPPPWFEPAGHREGGGSYNEFLCPDERRILQDAAAKRTSDFTRFYQVYYQVFPGSNA